MPHDRERPDFELVVNRFRCYVCAEPWWVPVQAFPAILHDCLVTGENTIFSFCDPCGERFEKEGLFWKDLNGKKES